MWHIIHINQSTEHREGLCFYCHFVCWFVFKNGTVVVLWESFYCNTAWMHTWHLTLLEHERAHTLYWLIASSDIVITYRHTHTQRWCQRWQAGELGPISESYFWSLTHEQLWTYTHSWVWICVRNHSHTHTHCCPHVCNCSRFWTPANSRAHTCCG